MLSAQRLQQTGELADRRAAVHGRETGGRRPPEGLEPCDGRGRDDVGDAGHRGELVGARGGERRQLAEPRRQHLVDHERLEARHLIEQRANDERLAAIPLAFEVKPARQAGAERLVGREQRVARGQEGVGELARSQNLGERRVEAIDRLDQGAVPDRLRHLPQRFQDGTGALQPARLHLAPPQLHHHAANVGDVRHREILERRPQRRLVGRRRRPVTVGHGIGAQRHFYGDVERDLHRLGRRDRRRGLYRRRPLDRRARGGRGRAVVHRLGEVGLLCRGGGRRGGRQDGRGLGLDHPVRPCRRLRRRRRRDGRSLRSRGRRAVGLGRGRRLGGPARLVLRRLRGRRWFRRRLVLRAPCLGRLFDRLFGRLFGRRFGRRLGLDRAGLLESGENAHSTSRRDVCIDATRAELDVGRSEFRSLPPARDQDAAGIGNFPSISK